ncbi:MAG: ImmA/IrrE family metallo-endopeptidase [Candidatus Thiodiazotropha sp. (ex Codakia orbicularis)]|nr:ImmA/IrrE family metallo-endopeptidase [Candidatus Thiodiazotropha sp. (ex Codakia orbicularis)]
MSSQEYNFTPDWVSPPGDTILDLMEERDWNQVELANRLGFSTKHLNQLIKGKVTLTYDTALKLERVLGSTVSFWMNRESKYRQHVARLEAEQNYKGWIDWLDDVPVNELKKIGAIENIRNIDSNKPILVEHLLSFFGVASPDEWRNYYGSMSVSFRKTKEEQADNGAISAWLRLGEIEAEKTSAPKYNRSKFESAIKRIRELTVQTPDGFYPALYELCLEAGVKLLLVKPIPKSRVSGVARWLNGHSPIIQLSLYGKTNDKFWFTFFHEVAHILLHSDEKSDIYLDNTDLKSKNQKELEANDWAGSILIPEEYRFDLVGLRSHVEILEFSKRINIHPGIVVGRLQHEGVIGYKSALNKLKNSFEIVS